MRPHRPPFSSLRCPRCLTVHGPEVLPILSFSSVVLQEAEAAVLKVAEGVNRLVEEERMNSEAEEVQVHLEEVAEGLMSSHSSRLILNGRSFARLLT